MSVPRYSQMTPGRFNLAIHRSDQGGESWNISPLLRIGIDGRDSLHADDIAVSHLMADIANLKYMNFAKVIDPIVSGRLLRVQVENKMFKEVEMGFFQDGPKIAPRGMIIFENVIVRSLRKGFENNLIVDIGTLIADRAVVRI